MTKDDLTKLLLQAVDDVGHQGPDISDALDLPDEDFQQMFSGLVEVLHLDDGPTQALDDLQYLHERLAGLELVFMQARRLLVDLMPDAERVQRADAAKGEADD